MAKFKVGDKVVIVHEGGGVWYKHYHKIGTECLIVEDCGEGAFRLQQIDGPRKQFVHAACFRSARPIQFTNK